MTETLDLVRKNEIDHYEILDSEPEVSFNNIVKLASKLLDAPYALISFVDDSRVWFKARVGIEETEIDKEYSICHLAINQDDVCVIEDITLDDRTKDLPICKSKYNIKFYAGIPIKNKNGINLGMLVIMDTRPRLLVKREIEILKDLSYATMNQLELRLRLRLAEKDRNQNTLMLAHDVKNFISNIQAAIPILVEANHNSDQKSFNELTGLLKSFANKNANIINQYIAKVKESEFKIELNFQEVDIVKVIKEVIKKNTLNAKSKSQIIEFNSSQSQACCLADEQKITEAIDNLVNNALKFSPFNSKIQVELKVTPAKKILIEVIDEGPGVTIDDLSKMFQKNAVLSAKPTGNEVSSGIGLWLTNQIVQSNGGKVFANKNCSGPGSKFSIELNCI